MEYRYIKVQRDNHCFSVTLSRPEKRNAFTPTMVNEIHHAFERANEDERVKIVVINAEGPVFCAGMDLKTFENPELDVINPNIENIDISLGEVFDKLNKPTIALVEGNVIAGAFLIVLGCTYVFCKREVQFRLPELALGIFPFQVMESLLRVMPEKKVLQLCIDTTYFDAEKAKELGIVDSFIEETNLFEKINSFEQIPVDALVAGIKSLRDLKGIPSSERYSFLKSRLHDLKENK